VLPEGRFARKQPLDESGDLLGQTLRSLDSVIEQSERLRPEVRHGVVPHLLRAVRLAVAEHVEADDVVPALGGRLDQLPVHEAREQQAGHEHDEPVVAAVLVLTRMHFHPTCAGA
jgi:hypothetical protein